MRSDLIFGALAHVTNRYQLCQLASKATSCRNLGVSSTLPGHPIRNATANIFSFSVPYCRMKKTAFYFPPRVVATARRRPSIV